MKTFELVSSAFPNEGDIPDLYTCRGRNVSPPLSFRNFPEGTESLALVMVDLDTPFGTITHWIVYNIPPEETEIAEAMEPGRILDNGICQGRNGMFRFGYMGPCPPWGRHRYVFRLFALDGNLQSPGTISRRRMLRLIEPRILAEATLLGYYSRGDKTR
jgi:Raf kinase inhibitor-like YbhB/YbcL family protein